MNKNLDKEFELKLMKWHELIFDNDDIEAHGIYEPLFLRLKLSKFELKSKFLDCRNKL